MLLTVSAAARRRQPPYPLPASGTGLSTPTYDGSGVTIHPSVVDMQADAGAPLGGYRWWMANTPYPNQDVTLENPSIWGSNDRINWTVPDGLTNPIDPYPGGGRINSDTELVWDPENEVLVCYWREYGMSAALKYYAATSPDGVTWTMQGSRLAIASGTAENLSPTIYRKASGDWRLWVYHNGGGAPVMYTATAALGPWTITSGTPSQTGSSGGYHGDIIRYEGAWISVHSFNSKMYAAVSTDDGDTWIGGAMMTDISGVYRPTFAPSTEAGYLDVWASSASRYYRLPDSRWLDLIP